MFSRTSTGLTVFVFFCGIAMLIGCRQQPSGKPRPPATGTSTNASQQTRPAPPLPANDSEGQSQLPPGHPPLGDAADQPSGPADPHAGMRPGMDTGAPKVMPEVDISGVKMTDTKVDLTGIRMTVPEGWVDEGPASTGGMMAAARKAQFRLPKAEGDPEDLMVAVTYFPNMKGMDDSNLLRWYGQFRQPDGSSTAAASFRADFQVGEDIMVTLVDISGTMASGGMMGRAGKPKENHRMLGAIINHPQGPHFIKVTGPSTAIERWKPSTMAFLRSAEIGP